MPNEFPRPFETFVLSPYTRILLIYHPVFYVEVCLLMLMIKDLRGVQETKENSKVLICWGYVFDL